MLWLALHFPSLPLEIHARGAQAPCPIAVADSTRPGAGIVACNAEARRRGIHPGMTASAAGTLVSNLRTRVRNPAAEHAAVERLASWALQYTPAVSVTDAEVLLEVSGSFKLFGGFNRLWTDIEHGIGPMGYAARIAAAPTPLAAQWFARAGLALRVRHADALRLSLDQLPIDALDLHDPACDTLRKAGVRTMGECLRLPRDGLARRVGPGLIDRLDRALGRIPDPRPAFRPPGHFKAVIDLPAPVEQADALLFAAHRLIAELCGLLAATGKGAQRLGITLSHEHRDATRFSLELVAASRDPGHLTNVLRERLERVALPCPTIALALESERLLPLASRSLSFLPDEREQAETALQLVERLRARLGPEAVQGFDAPADHRPERAWGICEPGQEGRPAPAWSPATRPLWLLEAPRPLAEIANRPQYHGPLALLTAPERIESGWWDGCEVTREYFVARNPAHALLWIYRELRGGRGWYLHGFFG